MEHTTLEELIRENSMISEHETDFKPIHNEILSHARKKSAEALKADISSMAEKLDEADYSIFDRIRTGVSEISDLAGRYRESEISTPNADKAIKGFSEIEESYVRMLGNIIPKVYRQFIRMVKSAESYPPADEIARKNSRHIAGIKGRLYISASDEHMKSKKAGWLMRRRLARARDIVEAIEKAEGIDISEALEFSRSYDKGIKEIRNRLDSLAKKQALNPGDIPAIRKLLSKAGDLPGKFYRISYTKPYFEKYHVQQKELYNQANGIIENERTRLLAEIRMLYQYGPDYSGGATSIPAAMAEIKEKAGEAERLCACLGTIGGKHGGIASGLRKNLMGMLSEAQAANNSCTSMQIMKDKAAAYEESLQNNLNAELLRQAKEQIEKRPELPKLNDKGLMQIIRNESRSLKNAYDNLLNSCIKAVDMGLSEEKNRIPEEYALGLLSALMPYTEARIKALEHSIKKKADQKKSREEEQAYNARRFMLKGEHVVDHIGTGLAVRFDSKYNPLPQNSNSPSPAPFSLKDYLSEGPVPESYGMAELGQIAGQEKPWVFVLNELREKLSDLPPAWSRKDLAYLNRMLDGIRLEKKSGRLGEEVMRFREREDVYSDAVVALNNYIARSEQKISELSDIR